MREPVCLPPRPVSVPIYQGGAEYSTIRQSKETLDSVGSISTPRAIRCSRR